MGSLDKRKNPLLLINGFKKLQEENSRSELIILGEGPLKEKILKIKKKKNLKNIKIYGYIKNPIRYLINSDLLISTSKSEGISRSMLESLFYGIPVMVSDVDGSSKIIKKYINGYVFKDDTDFILNFKKVLEWSSTCSQKRKCLLPHYLRQDYVGNLYLKNLI
jgi:CDP-glycerol glycerophosphotransferase